MLHHQFALTAMTSSITSEQWHQQKDMITPYNPTPQMSASAQKLYEAVSE